MKSCVSHKKIYLSLQAAEDALIEAWTKFEYRPGTGPISIYKCDDCGNYHFTSRGEMNERLKQHLEEGTIRRQREADYWIGKMKKK